jgi:signal transduction histidine kinase
VTNNENQKPNQLFARQSPLLVTTRVKLLLTFLVGLVITILVVFIARLQYIDSLLNRVETMSTLLDSSKVESLRANDANAKQNEAHIKRQLQQAHGVNSDAQALYVLATTKTNVVYYLVNSESPGSTAGEAYQDASEAIKASFYSGRPFVEGPVNDETGTRLSVVSPIFNSRGDQIAVVGMRIHSSAYYSVMALAALIPASAALLVAIVFIMTDTIRKRHQENVRMRSELVSIASHELRTPLTGIRWGEESLLRSLTLSKPNREVLQTMYDSTLRLQESIEDILQLANWQAGRNQELLKVSTDITRVLTDIFTTQKLPAAQNNVTLTFDPKWPKKKVLINCDTQRMKRVLNNLISNAIKYSKPGTSIVIAYQRVDSKHLITIKDHGIGIPRGEQERVFEGFYRASNAISLEANGTGMGLYMSRSTIEQHHGKLWLASEEGKGTTVYIQLP